MRLRGIKSEFYDSLSVGEKAKALSVMNIVIGFLSAVCAIVVR